MSEKPSSNIEEAEEEASQPQHGRKKPKLVTHPTTLGTIEEETRKAMFKAAMELGGKKDKEEGDKEENEE